VIRPYAKRGGKTPYLLAKHVLQTRYRGGLPHRVQSLLIHRLRAEIRPLAAIGEASTSRRGSFNLTPDSQNHYDGASEQNRQVSYLFLSY